MSKSKLKSQNKWNPRFLAYAIAKGCDPEDIKDGKGFVEWMAPRIREYENIIGCRVLVDPEGFNKYLFKYAKNNPINDSLIFPIDLNLTERDRSDDIIK